MHTHCHCLVVASWRCALLRDCKGRAPGVQPALLLPGEVQRAHLRRWPLPPNCRIEEKAHCCIGTRGKGYRKPGEKREMSTGREGASGSLGRTQVLSIAGGWSPTCEVLVLPLSTPAHALRFPHTGVARLFQAGRIAPASGSHHLTRPPDDPLLLASEARDPPPMPTGLRILKKVCSSQVSLSLCLSLCLSLSLSLSLCLPACLPACSV